MPSLAFDLIIEQTIMTRSAIVDELFIHDPGTGRAVCIRSCRTHWQPEFADVRLYDDFICRCRTIDTPLCRSACPGHPPVPLADEDLPPEGKKCEGPTGCRHCRYCPCGDNCCEGRANKHEIMKQAQVCADELQPPCERPLELDDHIPSCIWR